MSETLYGGVQNRRVTIRDLQRAKDNGERWPMLTAYDYSTARVFDAVSYTHLTLPTILLV